MSLSKEDFLKPVQLPTVDVELPGKGGAIRVKGLNAREWSMFESGFLDKELNRIPERWAQYHERLVVACCVDDEGKPLFDIHDIPLIGAQSKADIDAITDAAMEASGRMKKKSVTDHGEQPED